LIQKKQKIKSLETLLCRTRPLLCKSGKTWAGNFCPAVATLIAIALLQKFRYALPLHTRPPSFCLISSEAVLLPGEEASPKATPKERTLKRILIESKSKERGPDNKGGQKHTCFLDFFGYFLYQDKK
jgi:hypothetical protein